MTTDTVDETILYCEQTEHGGNGDHDRDTRMTELELSDRSADLKGILEALLFVSPEPLSVERFLGVLDGPSRGEVLEAIRELQKDYAADRRGLQVVEIAGGYQISTRPSCAAWIQRLEKAKAGARISRSAMETLAIIAYKQPLVRADIEQIRGVDSAGVLKTLLDRRLVRILGRKDIPGRPILYGTTKQFLQSFGLKDLAGLPALREIKELAEPDQVVLPIGDDGVMSDEAHARQGHESAELRHPLSESMSHN